MKLYVQTFPILFALLLFVASSCKSREVSSSDDLKGISTSCGTYVPKGLEDDANRVAWGTRIIDESLKNVPKYKKFFLIALGIFERGDVGKQANLQRFAKKVTYARSQPAVAHWQFHKAEFATLEEFPTGIMEGTRLHRDYEIEFAKILDRAVARYHCKNHPAFHFNLTGMDPSWTHTFTSGEIKVILAKPEYIERTQFYLNDRPVEVKDVKQMFRNLVKH